MTRVFAVARAAAVAGWIIGALGCVGSITRAQVDSLAPLRDAGVAAMGVGLTAAIVACRPGWSWRELSDGTPAWMKAGFIGTALLAGTSFLACLDPSPESRWFLSGHMATLSAAPACVLTVRLREKAPGRAAAMPGPRCPVCRQPMVESTVVCCRCSTPCHNDCWRYNGRCPVYACKGDRADPARA